jgi:hypothetical protein
MIDRHYGHLARDGREHAIRLLDELSAGQRPRWTLVDAAWTSKAASGASRDNETACGVPKLGSHTEQLICRCDRGFWHLVGCTDSIALQNGRFSGRV